MSTSQIKFCIQISDLNQLARTFLNHKITIDIKSFKPTSQIFYSSTAMDVVFSKP